MSKKFLVLLLVAGVLAIGGCQSSVADPDDDAHALADEDRPRLDTLLYPLDSALNDVRRFDSINHEYLGDTPIKAYRIAALDLLRAMGMPDSLLGKDYCKYRAARVYIGYGRNNAFKLFVIPIYDTVEGRTYRIKARRDEDLFFNAEGHIRKCKQGDKADTEPLYVMDLNAPCPNTCDTGSPLNPPPLSTPPRKL